MPSPSPLLEALDEVGTIAEFAQHRLIFLDAELGSLAGQPSREAK